MTYSSGSCVGCLGDVEGDTVPSEAAEYVREKWEEFLGLGARILDLQHRAANVAGAARERGDEATEAAAKAMIRTLGDLSILHGQAVDNLLPLAPYVGLGAIFVPVAVATAFASIALVVLWFFRKMALQEELLAQLEAGTLTEAGYLEAQEELGEIPGPLEAGADLAKWAVFGFVAWAALQLFGGSRFARNPPLTVFNRNPPDLMSRRVWALSYRHEADGEDYEHEFAPGVEMESLEDGSLLLSHPSRPIWRDF